MGRKYSSLFILLALSSYAFSSNFSENIYLKYDLTLVNESNLSDPTIHLRSLALERYKLLGLSVGKFIFSINLHKLNEIFSITNNASHNVIQEANFTFCSTDDIEVLITVIAINNNISIINYTISFYNFTAVSPRTSYETITKFFGEPSTNKDGTAIWKKEMLSISRILTVNMTSGDTSEGSYALGEWVFWIAQPDRSLGKTLILAGVNLDFPVFDDNLSAFVGYLLFFNMSNSGSRDYYVSGVKVERARTAVASSYPLPSAYIRVPKGGRVSEDVKRTLRMYGCTVNEFFNSTIEVNCSAFWEVASLLKGRKAWRTLLLHRWVNPNLFRADIVIEYSGLRLMILPLDTFNFVYDIQTGLLLEASHDTSMGIIWGYAPSYLSTYLATDGYVPLFRSLSGPLSLILVETNAPLVTPTLGSTGGIGLDAAYILLVSLAILVLIYYAMASSSKR